MVLHFISKSHNIVILKKHFIALFEQNNELLLVYIAVDRNNKETVVTVEIETPLIDIIRQMNT